MERLRKLAAYQQEAVDKLSAADYNGTLHLPVGFGKTFTSYMALYKAVEEGKLELGDSIKLMAETEVRRKTFSDEANKFESLFGKNPFKDFKFDFYCYQRCPYTFHEWGIYDEIHCTITPKYMYNLVENKPKRCIGLSATIPYDKNVFKNELEELWDEPIYQSKKDIEAGKITKYITKGQLLDMYLPVVYHLPMDKMVEENILSAYETYLIYHNLDNKNRKFKIWKNSPTLQTEEKWLSEKLRASRNYQLNNFVRTNISKVEIPKFLYNLPSKADVVKRLLEKIPNNRVIIFAEQLDLLQLILPDERIYAGKKGDKNNRVTKPLKENLAILNKFNNKEFNVIGSLKMLQQGITLNDLDTVIFASYNSSNRELIQKIGRVVRFKEDKIGRVYFIITKGTYEERWFREMQLIKNEKQQIIGKVSLNIMGERNSNII